MWWFSVVKFVTISSEALTHQASRKAEDRELGMMRLQNPALPLLLP
jgi:hypothetical protein